MTGAACWGPRFERDLTRWLVALHAVEQQAIVHLNAAAASSGNPRSPLRARATGRRRASRVTLRARSPPVCVPSA